MSSHNRLDAHAALVEAKEAVHRPDFRRAVVAGLLALAAPGVYYYLGGLDATGGKKLGVFISIGVCGIFGLLAVRSAANEMARLVGNRGGISAASVLRWVITLTGYLIVVLEVITLLGVPIERLLLSGAITGVIVGIAAQQSLGNAFAGLVLFFSRPFVVGDFITLRSGALGGQYDGTVTAITLMYTRLSTEDGPISLPNSGVLAAAAGPREPKPLETETDVEPPPVTEPPAETEPEEPGPAVAESEANLVVRSSPPEPSIGPRRTPGRGLRGVPAVPKGSYRLRRAR